MNKLPKTNYHTHTQFCDGRDSAEQMIQAAIAKNFDTLGFSAHSLFPFSSDWHLPSREHHQYVNSIRSLAQKYKDSLLILCGFEADFVQGICAPDFARFAEFVPDFLIGSVHYVPGTEGFIEADGAAEQVRQGITKHFGGDVKKAVQTYFDCERNMLRTGSFSIMGHPDLIRKQNATRKLFDETDGWYREELRMLAHDIARAGVYVEINTGGMARRYLDTPYPGPQFLDMLHERGVPITLCSDAHCTEHLDFYFPEALQYVKAHGYTELACLDDTGWKQYAI